MNRHKVAREEYLDQSRRSDDLLTILRSIHIVFVTYRESGCDDEGEASGSEDGEQRHDYHLQEQLQLALKSGQSTEQFGLHDWGKPLCPIFLAPEWRFWRGEQLRTVNDRS